MVLQCGHYLIFVVAAMPYFTDKVTDVDQKQLV